LPDLRTLPAILRSPGSADIISLLKVTLYFPGMKDISEFVFFQAFIPNAVIDVSIKSILRWFTS